MLKRLYKWLFESCEHKWEFESTVKTFSEWTSGDLPIKIQKIYICSKCLKTKKVNL